MASMNIHGKSMKKLIHQWRNQVIWMTGSKVMAKTKILGFSIMTKNSGAEDYTLKSSAQEFCLKISQCFVNFAQFYHWISHLQGVLKLKLYKVHYAAKSSELARRIWLHSAPSAVSTQCQQRGSQVHWAELARQGVLGYPWVDIGEELVKFSSLLRWT